MGEKRSGRKNHGLRSVPVVTRLSQRQREILNLKTLGGNIAELAKEHETLGTDFKKFVENHNHLVLEHNALNQRANMLLTELEFHRTLFCEIGHVHSAVLGRTVEFTAEEYHTRLDRLIAIKRRQIQELFAARKTEILAAHPHTFTTPAGALIIEACACGRTREQEDAEPTPCPLVKAEEPAASEPADSVAAEQPGAEPAAATA